MVLPFSFLIFSFAVAMESQKTEVPTSKVPQLTTLCARYIANNITTPRDYDRFFKENITKDCDELLSEAADKRYSGILKQFDRNFILKTDFELKFPDDHGHDVYIVDMQLNRTGDRIFVRNFGWGTMFETATGKHLYTLKLDRIDQCDYCDPYICTYSDDERLVNIWDACDGKLIKSMSVNNMRTTAYDDQDMSNRSQGCSIANDGNLCTVVYGSQFRSQYYGSQFGPQYYGPQFGPHYSKIIDWKNGSIIKEVYGAVSVLENGYLLYKNNKNSKFKIFKQDDLSNPIYSGDYDRWKFKFDENGEIYNLNFNSNTIEVVDYERGIKKELKLPAVDFSKIALSSKSGIIALLPIGKIKIYDLSDSHLLIEFNCSEGISNIRMVLSGDGKKIVCTYDCASCFWYSLDDFLFLCGRKDETGKMISGRQKLAIMALANNVNRPNTGGALHKTFLSFSPGIQDGLRRNCGIEKSFKEPAHFSVFHYIKKQLYEHPIRMAATFLGCGVLVFKALHKLWGFKFVF